MKNEKELNKVVENAIVQYNTNRELISKIKEDLLEIGILGGIVQGIFNKQIPFHTDLGMLYHILKSLHANTDRKEFNPSNYFTEREISVLKNYKKDIQQESPYPIVIPNVKKIGSDYYSTYMTAQEVSDFYAKNVVIYNTETQRQIKARKYGNQIVEEININQKSVSDIQDKILNGTFFTNHITFNILSNGEEEIKYYPDMEELVIQSGEIDILDGFHRSLGILKAVLINPMVDYTSGIIFTNYDISRAREYIAQEDKRNPINKRLIKEYEQNYDSLVVQKINERADSQLKGKITTNKLMINYNQAYALSDLMSDAVRRAFKLETIRDVNIAADFLVEGFNEITGLYAEHFITNVEEMKKKSVMNHPYQFVGYVALLSELKDKENWKNQLQETLSTIDYNIDNKLWEELGLFDTSFRNNNKKRLMNFYKKE